MPTIITHAAVGLFATPLAPVRISPGVLLASLLCPVLPDLDVLAFSRGIPYGAMLGHRGLSHSLLAAAVIGILAALFFYRLGFPRRRIFFLMFYFMVLTSTHTLLDAMTSGGLGVAFLAPFDTTRFFLPVRPIPVSPLGLQHFLSNRGLAVMLGELRVVWLPGGTIFLFALVLRIFRLHQQRGHLRE